MPTATRKRPYRRISQIKLGENRGKPRVYLQGKYLLKAGFEPATTIEADFFNDRVVVRIDGAGSRKVSSKGGATPVIDITGQDLANVFGTVRSLEVRTTNGEITITPARTARQRSARVRNGREGSAFSGGGLLSEAARHAGHTPAFAIEIEPQYAEVFEENHPEADMIQAPIEAVDSSLLADHPIELLTLGVPCQPFSNAWRNTDGQTKRGAGVPEEHELGHMTFWALRLIDAANPYTALVENVPGYLNSGAYQILRGALNAMGYTVEARILSPLDFGGLSDRRRAVILAHTDSEIRWPIPVSGAPRRLGELLEPADQVEWFNPETKAWLYRHWERQTAKGNGFASQIVTADSTQVGTIKKGYTKEQGDNPVVAHPTRANTHRWFTLTELKRLHGLPDGYHLGRSKRLAGEIIGQGVDVTLFRQVIAAVTGRSPGVSGEDLDRLIAKRRSTAEDAADVNTLDQLALVI